MGELSPVHWLIFLVLVVVISIANVAGYIPDDKEASKTSTTKESRTVRFGDRA
jgi:hypothetical protein